MPQNFEAHLKGFLVTCVGLLAGSLGVFISILSVVISPLFSLFSTPEPIFIGEGKAGLSPRFQHPSHKIRPRYTRQSSSDKSSSHSSNTLSSNGTTHSIYSYRTTDDESQQALSPNGTRFRSDTYNSPESPVPPPPSTPALLSSSLSPAQPRSPRDGLRTYRGTRKWSTLLDEPTPEEPSLGEVPDLGGLDEQELSRAEIIISPPTPSSFVFSHSASGPSEARSDDASMPGKPPARFVKCQSKRHSLSSACSRKRRSGKRSSNPPTPTSTSPTVAPVVESRWRVATRVSQRKKRMSLRIDPPRPSPSSPVFIQSGDDVGGGVIHEEPISITRPPIPQPLPSRPRQGPTRTRPYEAPYFFPTPGSPEAIGYVEKVREERRSVFAHPDTMFVRNKRSSTFPSLDKDGTTGTLKSHGKGNQDQAIEGSSKKQPKTSERGSGDRNTNPLPPIPTDEFGVSAGTPKIRKSSAPPQFSPSPDCAQTPTTPPGPPRRQGSRGIMRMLGKH